MQQLRNQLHRTGRRLTQQRQLILAQLTQHPQTVTEICQRLTERGQVVDKVTVYRTLDCLVEMELVTKTQFRDHTAQFELVSEAHHHHVVCDHCGQVADVPLNEDELLQQVQQKTNFMIKSHSLEFFGLCANCQ